MSLGFGIAAFAPIPGEKCIAIGAPANVITWPPIKNIMMLMVMMMTKITNNNDYDELR